MAIINISNLQREAKTYQPVLQMLPFTTLAEALAALNINLVEVKDKDTIVIFERKGGSTMPYLAADPDDETVVSEIGRVKERPLSVDPCVLVFRDHIKNYTDKIVINGQSSANNQDKKHPLERLILESIVKTIAEDIVDAMFFAKRDTSDQTPMGMFDGFNEIIDTEISGGDIATGKGNLINTGAISAPADEEDTDAIDKVVAFIRSAQPKLRKNGILKLNSATLFNIMDAMGNKLRFGGAMAFEVFMNYLRGMCDAPSLQIKTHECLGTGSRLIYTMPGNFDLGMRTKTDQQFIQVRDAYKDPNWVQFWAQFEAGARIINTHAKTFAVNDQSNTAVELSGDYQS